MNDSLLLALMYQTSFYSLTHFRPLFSFYIPIKTSNYWFSNVFRGSKNRKINLKWVNKFFHHGFCIMLYLLPKICKRLSASCAHFRGLFNCFMTEVPIIYKPVH